MDRIKISLDVTNASEYHNMGIELWIDQTRFFDNTISPGRHHVIHEFECADGEHWFKIVLKNKTHENTRIDEQGNIATDALINISNVCLDEIDIDNMMHNLADYVHDGNGSQTIAVHDFFGDLGCNGQVQLRFSAPLYLWLLENM
jgi:hypothetical protein